ESFQKAALLDNEAHRMFASLGFAYALTGNRKEATKILRRLRRAAKTSFVSASNFALIHLGMGDEDEAYAWLDKAYDERSSALPFVGVNPRFASLRGTPRFEKLLHRIGLP